MTVKMLTAWNGYPKDYIGSVISPSEEARLVGIGFASYDLDGVDNDNVRMPVTATTNPLTGGIAFSGLNLAKLENPARQFDRIRVAFVGDSMSSLSSDSLARGFNAFVEQLGGDAVVGVHASSLNWGFARSGAPIQALVDEGFGVAAANSDATHVTFLVGANSISSSDAEDAANLESLRRLIAPSAAAGKFITVCAPLQRTNETNATNRLHMSRFAQMALDYAESNGFFAVDFHTDSINRSDGNIRPSITADQVHPVMAWNWVMAKKLLDAWGVTPRHNVVRGLISLIDNPYLQSLTGWTVSNGTAAEYQNTSGRGGVSQKITAVALAATAASVSRVSNASTDANRRYTAVAEVEIFEDSNVTGILLEAQMYFTPVAAPWFVQRAAGGFGSPFSGEVYMPKGVYFLTVDMSLPNPSGTNGINLQIANGYAVVHYLGIVPR